MTTTYRLLQNAKEIKYHDRYNIEAGCTVDTEGDNEPEVVKAFDNKEDALEALKEYAGSVAKIDGNSIYFKVLEYFIEKEERDNEGEYLNSDILEFSKMKIEVMEKPSYDVVATFDTYKDAEQYVDAYNGDNELYIL